MDANSTDQKLFYKLINRQRSTPNQTDMILCEGELITSDVAVTDAWKDYFQKLGTPEDNPNFDDSYIHQVEADMETITQLNDSETKHVPVSVKEVATAIKKLNNGKAADASGLQAEHIKYAGESIYLPLSKLFNKILTNKKVPLDFKKGIVIPVLKKDKDQLHQENYRGITLTSVIGKVFENVLLNRMKPILEKRSSKLQRGFTSNTSSLSAGLLVSEITNEAKDHKSELYFATLDARKAFDVVCHSSLLRKLHIQGIKDELWCVISDLYDNASCQVKWKGILSDPIKLLQGVHQGRVTSTELYKSYIDPLLHRLAAKRYGSRIGHLYVGTPTCADDLLLAANNFIELQYMLDEAGLYSQKERYILHPQKSAVIPMRSSISFDEWQKLSPWTLNNETIKISEAERHLGVERTIDPSFKNIIQNRILVGRRTTYALMGAGLHGLNGISPPIALKLISTYVEPRYLHGLEILNPPETDLRMLNTYQKKVLKQIQHLPERTANEATFLLLGALPIKARIDLNQLSLFRMVIANQSVEREVAERQLAMKDLKSKSWFVAISKLLIKYGLPSAHDLLLNPPSKEEWKHLTNEAVKDFWNDQLKSNAALKPSLKYLHIEGCSIGSTHPIWRNVEPNQRDVYRATIKAKLLTGTYILQGNRAKFNQFNIDPTCLLCKKAAETREHFLVSCSALCTQREPFLQNMKDVCENLYPDCWSTLAESAETLTQLILDSTYFASYPNLHVCCEPISRHLVYRLHVTRSAIISALN